MSLALRARAIAPYSARSRDRARLGLAALVLLDRERHVVARDAVQVEVLGRRAVAPLIERGAALGGKEHVKAIIVDGRDIKNFAALLNGKDFAGTIIG